VAGQTRQVLESIDRLLAEAGSDKTRILSATIYLANIATFAEMNLVWDTWVSPQLTPARATVEARLAASVYKVEIQVIAAR
jgi:enamine deaminase RidA (YjgF/YER057c/UK114 family)